MGFLLNVLSTTVVSSLLLGAGVWLLRTWIMERLQSAIRHEYDRDIEAYKSVLGRVHAATADGQKAAIEARMRGFDRLWKAMLALRDNAGPIAIFFDVLTVEEYGQLKSHTHFQAIVGKLDESKIQSLMPDPGVEEVRPYVGETVWSYFYIYQAFNLRLVALAVWSKEDEEKINWHRDVAIRGLLSAALGGEEMKRLDGLQIGKIAYVRQILELKVLTHWHGLISGKEFGDEAVNQAQSMLTAVARMNTHS